MTRELILRNRLEMAQHNLLCYSANYLCTTPKEGQEDQFKEAAKEVEMLTAWLKEFHSTHTDSTVEFIGHINAISHGRTWDGRNYAESLEFEVDTGASYLYGDRRIFNISNEVQDWFVEEDKCIGRYDREKDYRSSRLLKITVDRIMYIRAIEWAEEDEWAKEA